MNYEKTILKTWKICNKLMNLDRGHTKVLVANPGQIGAEAMVDYLDEGISVVFLDPDWLSQATLKDVVITIAHELVHVRQFLDGELVWEDDENVCYKGTWYRHENHAEYWLAPWEIEARGWESAIWELFVGFEEE